MREKRTEGCEECEEKLRFERLLVDIGYRLLDGRLAGGAATYYVFRRELAMNHKNRPIGEGRFL